MRTVSCPLRPLEWHEDDDDDYMDFIPIPARRRPAPKTPSTAQVLRQVYEVARDYERSLEEWEAEVEKARKRSTVPVHARVLSETDPQGLYALAIVTALAAVGVGMLGHGLMKSLPVAAQLEGQLSGQLRTLSLRRGGGKSGGGKFSNWTEKLRASGGSRGLSPDSEMTTLR